MKSEFAKEINPEINIKYETLDELFVDGKFSYDSTQKAYKNLTNNEYMPRNMGELLDKLSEIYPSNLKVGKFIDEYKNYHSKEEVDEMYKNLCFLLCAKKLNFELFEMKFNPSIKDKPKIDSAYLKLLDYIKQNGKLVSFFTPKYENASIDENVDFEFLPYFDGTRSFDELVNELIKIEKDGKFRFVIEDRTVTSKEKIASLAKNYVKAKIQFLYENAFLV